MIKVGDTLRCIFTEPLPGKDYAPPLKKEETYTCKALHVERVAGKVFLHIDVGLPLELNYVKSYATDEELPKTTHWCHPNRFIVIQ